MVILVKFSNFQHAIPHLLMSRSFLPMLLFGFLVSCKSSGPYPNIRIDRNEGFGLGPCEPSIAIDPNNPNRLVAGAVLDRAYYSHDGGKTWNKQQISSSYGVWGDPVILADYQGNFYYFHLSFPSGEGDWDSDKLDRMVCQVSTDGGQSWSDGSYTGWFPPKDQDKEWAVADPRNNHIYLTWTQFDAYGSDNPNDKSNILFSRSTDEGSSWSTAISINQIPGNCLDDDGTTEGAVPAVGPNGEIYVAWALNEKIYFDRSLDGGDTWLKQDKVIGEQVNGWDQEIPGVGRANGMPVTICDLSNGPHRGRIYVNWSDQRNGADNTDIWMAYSDDGGDQWSEPRKVNTDQESKHQFFPWATIDQTNGHIYVVFYDRRQTEGLATEVYLATSADGGQSFTNEKISAEAFTSDPGVFFGDYNHIAAFDGRVRPIWTQVKDGQLSIWTALIDK